MGRSLKALLSDEDGGVFLLASKELVSSVKGYEQYILDNGIDEQVIQAYLSAAQVAILEEKDSDYGLEITDRGKELIQDLVKELSGGTVWDLEKFAQQKGMVYELIDQYYELLKLESFDRFESFLFYMERKRPYRKRFYQPRQRTLRIIVDDLQSLEDKDIEFQGISMPSRTGKSSTCILFLLWIAMKRPNSHNAMGGHSGILAKGFYKELLNMMTSEEYTFKELYLFWHPEYENKPFPTDKSAEDFTITLGDLDRFATITCRGIDGTWTGAVDVSSDGYLYVDDLIRDRQHSLSPVRMDDTFQEYLNKMVDRKNDGAKELMVGTLWAIGDPLERTRLKYAGNSRYQFRKIPALNDKDESNFDYEINGFSTEYYRNMRDKLDNAEWMAKFQQQPYVREGLLFPSEECRYFNGIVPEEECRTWAVCDPAFGGADSLSMPIIKDYGLKKKYIVGWVHKKGTQAVTVPRVVDAIVKYHISELHIEQNSGGKLITDSIKAEMKRRDVRHCMIIPYYASTRMSKADKIKGYSDWVKENLLFLLPNNELSLDDKSEVEYKRDEDYQRAMNELNMYTSEGKNEHDDSPDVVSQIAIIDGKKGRQTKIISSPI